MEPSSYAWIVAGRLVAAERPGGGGRGHRRGLREVEQAWWRAQGVGAIVSGMRSRHGLLEYALDDFVVRWHPLTDPDRAHEEVPPLVAAVCDLLEAERGAVLVHVDRPSEWLAGVDAALRRSLGLAKGLDEALAQAGEDGFPVGPTARRLAEAAPARAPV
jgi:hypothetical protein